MEDAPDIDSVVADDVEHHVWESRNGADSQIGPEADASFEAAVEWHERMPAPVLLARTQINWATSLLQRPDPDTDRADELVTASTTAAERLGLGNVLVRAANLCALR